MLECHSAKNKPQHKPRLLFIVALPPPFHGVTVANALLTGNLFIRDKYDIAVVSLEKPKLEVGGKLYIGTLANDLIATLKILRSLITFKPQLTYFCLSQTQLGMWRDALWIWSASVLGSKLLSHLHGGYFRHFFEKDLDQFQQDVLKKTLARVDGLIVLDKCFEKLFDGLVVQEKILILPNGIDAEMNENELADAGRQREISSRLRVTFLSNLVPGKGYDTFLATGKIVNISGTHGQMLFRLAGASPNGNIAATTEIFVRSHRLDNSIKIIGQVIGQEKWRLLLDSDIFVLPTSLPEGQPITILEALAAGLPIIATPKGAIPSMVKDGINGYLVPEGNPEAIAERLYYLHKNPEVRLAMGRASRELYLKHFTADRFIQGFANIVDQVLARN